MCWWPYLPPSPPPLSLPYLTVIQVHCALAPRNPHADMKTSIPRHYYFPSSYLDRKFFGVGTTVGSNKYYQSIYSLQYYSCTASSCPLKPPFSVIIHLHGCPQATLIRIQSHEFMGE